MKVYSDKPIDVPKDKNKILKLASAGNFYKTMTEVINESIRAQKENTTPNLKEILSNYKESQEKIKQAIEISKKTN